MDGWRNEVLFFPGEDAEAIKTRFVEVCAQHQNRFTPFEVAQYVFKHLREPQLRAGQAAELWGSDLDVLERVRMLMTKGSEKPDVGDSDDIVSRAYKIADDPHTENKDRINALTLIARIKGALKKEVELNAGIGAGGNAELLAALAQRLPA